MALVGTTKVTAVLISHRAVTGLRTGRSGLESRQVQCLCFLQKVPTGCRTPPPSWYRALAPRVEQLGSEVNHFPVSSAKVGNERS